MLQENKAYSEKEKAVFESVMRLLREGVDWSMLKVADIAAAAGIGKGTVYGYFTSKDEIFEKSVEFGTSAWLDNTLFAIGEKQSFDEKITAAIACIDDGAKDKHLLLRMQKDVKSDLQDMPLIKIVENAISALIADIMDAGVREKKVATEQYTLAATALFYLLAGYAVVAFTEYPLPHQYDPDTELKHMLYAILRQ